MIGAFAPREAMVSACQVARLPHQLVQSRVDGPTASRRCGSRLLARLRSLRTETAMHAGFGLGRIHHLPTGRSREQVVRTAIDAGFRHFDLAPAYGDGLCERELGRILGSERSRVRIATKFGIPFRAIGELPGALYFALRATAKVLSTSFGARYGERDFGPAELASSLENSLRRLRTDYIDLLLVHEPRTLDDFRSIGGSWTELERQKKLGKIRDFGVSADVELLLEAEQQGLVPAGAVRMIPLCARTLELPEAWFRERSVFVFNVVKHLRGSLGPGRIESQRLVETVARLVPESTPIFASHDLNEIRRLGSCIASVVEPKREMTA
jgi:Aldo/keto reductase family